MSGAVVIMTCDKYSPFWEGLYHYMIRHWDFSIPWPIYFCNESIEVEFARPEFRHLPVGPGPFHERQVRILNALREYDHIFFMLEEYWPTQNMTKEMFLGLYDMMVRKDWDCLHVDTIRPDLYKLKPTPHAFDGRRILRFDNDSEWIFNQQAGFWKRELMLNCVVPPEVSEVEVSSSVTVEHACDKYMRANYPDINVMLYPYWWYPRAGVVWRGVLSPIGEEMVVQMNIHNWGVANLDIENKKPQLEC